MDLMTSTIPLMRVAIARGTGKRLGQPKPAGEVTLGEWMTREDTATTMHDLVPTLADDGSMGVYALEMVWADAPKHWPFPTFMGDPIERKAEELAQPARVDIDTLPPALL